VIVRASEHKAAGFQCRESSLTLKWEVKGRGDVMQVDVQI
jgi:hypothetical protein